MSKKVLDQPIPLVYNKNYNKVIIKQKKGKQIMAKSTKIIAALGIAGMLGMIAMPTFAASTGLKSITDNVNITVDAVCGFTTNDSATDDDAAPTATIANGAENAAIKTHKFNVVCNRTEGYTVKAEASGLASGSNTIEFKNTSDYGAVVKTGDNKAEAGAWTATVTKGDGSAADGTNIKDNVLSSTGGGEIVNKGTTSTAGDSFNVTYKAYVGTKTPAGTYTGTVTYTISADA